MAKFVLAALSGSRRLPQLLRPAWQRLPAVSFSSDAFPPQGPNVEPPIPPYQEKVGETVELKRARLLYQSRKRGMLENGLLLSTFASKFLDKLDEEQLSLYDRLINMPTNDWEIYYWVTGVKPTPEEYDNGVMDMLKEHARNSDKESRIRQPDLPSA